MRGFVLILAIGLLLTVPVQAQHDSEVAWYDQPDVDADGDSLGNNLELALKVEGWVQDGRISVLVDFNHPVDAVHSKMLEDSVDFEVRHRFTVVDIISGTVPVDRLDQLADLDGVVLISLNGRVSGTLDTAVGLHDVSQVREEYDYSGEGVTIAVIDTGLAAGHVGLDDLDDDNETHDPKIVAFYDVVNDPGNNSGNATPYDDQGHGSHVGGIVSGTGAPDGQFTGVAPGANLVGVKVLDETNTGSFEDIMAGMEWVILNKDLFDIRVASISIGGFFFWEFTTTDNGQVAAVANLMVDAGIVTVIAAGNGGGVYGTIQTPGVAEKVITVGNVNDVQQLAADSSRGPATDRSTGSVNIKPDVVAVGTNVMSIDGMTTDGYREMSGTSMATPIVAGVSALMIQANPEITPEEIKTIFSEQSEYLWEKPQDAIVQKNNDFGWGFIHSMPAVTVAGNISDTLRLFVDEVPETVNPGGGIELTVEGDYDDIELRVLPDGSWESLGVEGEVFVVPVPEEEGNYTYLVRAVSTTGSSPIVRIEFQVTTPAGEASTPTTIGAIIGAGALLLITAWLLTEAWTAKPESERSTPIEMDRAAEAEDDEVAEAAVLVEAAES